MKDWCEMWNTNLITISLYTGKKMICALRFIIRNHYGIKCLISPSQSITINDERLIWNVKYKSYYY